MFSIQSYLSGASKTSEMHNWFIDSELSLRYFHTLMLIVHNAFLQSVVSKSLKYPSLSSGPRLPQHGVHCKVEGRAALDILRNFEERWKKQAPLKKSFLSKVNCSDFLLEKQTMK